MTYFFFIHIEKAKKSKETLRKKNEVSLCFLINQNNELLLKLSFNEW
jgi:HEPN domain-containing protein